MHKPDGKDIDISTTLLVYIDTYSYLLSCGIFQPRIRPYVFWMSTTSPSTGYSKKVSTSGNFSVYLTFIEKLHKLSNIDEINHIYRMRSSRDFSHPYTISNYRLKSDHPSWRC